MSKVIIFNKNKVSIDPVTGHINFIAEVDNKDIVCIVQTSALDKLNQTYHDKISFFNQNRYLFEDIAENKINNNEIDIVILEDDIL